MGHLWSLGHGCGSRKSESWSHWSSYQGVGEAVVLVKVLVLERHVAVVDGHGQLALAEQPLLSQVVVDLVPGLHKMVRLAVTVKILGVVNSTNIQHVLDALARIPCPLPSKKLHHKRGRTTPHAITPHQKAGQVSPTNTVLT